jgi:hypothetical protein
MCIVFTQCKTGDKFIKSLSLRIDSFFFRKKTKNMYSALFSKYFLEINNLNLLFA